MGGNTTEEGNVFLNGAPVCDYGWGWEDANVACRSLGYNYIKKIVGTLILDQYLTLLSMALVMFLAMVKRYPSATVHLERMLSVLQTEVPV